MRFLRSLLILVLLAAVIGGVAYYIVVSDAQKRRELYDLSVTLSIQTAVGRALFDATRTAESDTVHYRLVKLGEGERLLDVASRYRTTVDVLRMANNLLPTVDSGNGETIIVPQGVQVLDPPRRFNIYTAVAGDTLAALATRNSIPLEILQRDNPILNQRGINPGDIVFVAQLL